MDESTSAPTTENNPEPSLLPKVLLHRAAFLWLWVLPAGVLLLLNLQGYWLIEGNMDPAQRSQALLFGSAGLANFLLGLAFYGLGWRTGGDSGTSPAGSLLRNLPVVIIQVAYLWLAVSLLEDHLLPSTVTLWIYPPERFLFNQFAFAMLPLFLGILRIAGARPVAGTGKAIALNLGLAVAAPVFLYLFFNILQTFDSGRRIGPVIWATGAIVLGLVMFVAIVRGLMLVLRSVGQWSAHWERAAIVVIALVLPVGGLLLNRSIPFPVDFQATEVYVLVLANTVILLTASYQHARRPRLSFCLLSVTFPFSLYFFIVFLPYTPLSILAVLALGTGFLVLTPTFLFTLHLYLLGKSRSNPLLGPGRLGVTLAGLACCLVLPAFFTLRGLADKSALNAALDYAYAPEVKAGDMTYPASLGNLRRALDSHRSYKNGLYYPLLSDYYSWLVFDNLVLPDDKLARIEAMFFDSVGSKADIDPVRQRNGFLDRGSVRGRAHMPRAVPVPRTVEVRQLDVRAAPAGDRQTAVTVVLTLANTGSGAAEYVKALPLPAGVYVSGFRLHINGRPVPGRLFEKKTALWVYTMIRDSERRDPGLLFYNSPAELELRVFPVNHDKPAVVEIDFLVPAALAAANLATESKDAAAVLTQLGNLLSPRLGLDARGRALVSGLTAETLPDVEREPYLHLIVDRSKGNGFDGDLAEAIRRLREKFPAARSVRVTLANYNVADLMPRLTPLGDLASIAGKKLEWTLPRAGGLALDLAIAHAIRGHRDADLEAAPAPGWIPPRPIFVILSGKVQPRRLELELTGNWTDLLGGLEIHELGADGTLITQRAATAPAMPLLRLGHSVRSLGSAGQAGVRFESAGANDELEYWAPESATWRPVAGIERLAGPTVWSRAVELQFQQQDLSRSPGGSALDLRALVKASRESGVLIPATSYIVVENQAQWNMLDLGERQKLGQNAALDFLEVPAPPALYVVLCFGVWFGFRRRRQTSNRRLAEAA